VYSKSTIRGQAARWIALACVVLVLVAGSAQASHECRFVSSGTDQQGSTAPDHARSCPLCANAHAAPLTPPIAQLTPEVVALEVDLPPTSAAARAAQSSALHVRAPPAH
jgi:hypothetical protein